MVLALPVAVLAGLVSFFSPCVVPLLPGYLSYATGLGAADVVAGRGRRSRMLFGALGFVLGFALVFVITGTVIGGAGSALLGARDVITKVLGVVVIIVGLIFAGFIGIGQRDLRLERIPTVGIAASPLLGIVFGLGWTPCIGPTLTVVYSLAYNEGSALRGAVLAFAYAVGLGLPFVIAALAFSRMNRLVRVVQRHQKLIMRIGGISMVLVGLLLITGVWDLLMAQLRNVVALFTPLI
ncbi:cytochrome c biogenesis CcdA family protein [Propionibacteriaceae bacterium Y1685]|uniref:cytochrome c biogenesis CcdA family protein n=1 Tax=Microlunatus sp. Y1700 TaxID=3418487 RepID=UPI003B7EDB7F